MDDNKNMSAKKENVNGTELKVWRKNPNVNHYRKICGRI